VFDCVFGRLRSREHFYRLTVRQRLLVYLGWD
jgi:hypothetical protein